ncbi:probable E3 ubiquitin-protein ligase HERC1 [Nilaparvata lugens]|uniref:probable E3 ubiquitin-protein ligase HERC1 n=1 Tax=Nilaparvata lugens TaxID=108931 RepID=UPI00193E0309|nr:probable E3 ubiquitin-protein ligase HERC1 [Nilaparvata lugens]
MSNGYHYMVSKYNDQFNTDWSCIEIEHIANRENLSTLYERLVNYKELVPYPEHVLLLVDSAEDSCYIGCSNSEPDAGLHRYASKQLAAQWQCARRWCMAGTFSTCLQHRLAILQRVWHALQNIAEKPKLQTSGAEKEPVPAQTEASRDPVVTSCEPQRTCNQALLEIAVKSGISLLFALLRQSSAYSTITGRYMSFVSNYGFEYQDEMVLYHVMLILSCYVDTVSCYLILYHVMLILYHVMLILYHVMLILYHVG